jgi:hypothetical protein
LRKFCWNDGERPGWDQKNTFHSKLRQPVQIVGIVENAQNGPLSKGPFDRHVPDLGGLPNEQVHGIGYIYGRRADPFQELNAVVRILRAELPPERWVIGSLKYMPRRRNLWVADMLQWWPEARLAQPANSLPDSDASASVFVASCLSNQFASGKRYGVIEALSLIPMENRPAISSIQHH